MNKEAYEPQQAFEAVEAYELVKALQEHSVSPINTLLDLLT